ncbi:MAG: zinc ribbon domain-containing protein [Vicinamibacterales bacterium]|nr:zinc ribbon domain-containing protein [Vicinamibacterales bacterium]
MPLYEYVCQTCAHRFELLVRGSDTPACPTCQGQALERQLSVFAAHTAGATPRAAAAAGGCGRCGDPRGPGACSMN